MKRRLRTISKRFFRREKIYVFERALDVSGLRIEAKVKIDAKNAQRNDISRFTEGFRTKAEKRSKMGHTCVIADFQGEIVHYSWVAFNKVYAGELEKELHISSDSAYCYDRYTVPEYRGLGIAPQVMVKTFSFLYDKGFKKVYVCVRHNNFPSLRAVQKEGFRKIGTIIFTRIIKLRQYSCEYETEEDYSKLKEMFSL